jgi:DNA-binding NarL/FixJ family response regulator
VTASQPVRVLIADDDQRVRKALAELIGDEPGLEVIGVVADAYAAIDFAQSTCPDVAILDLLMPGGGPHAARQLLEMCPSIRVIGLSALGDQASASSMLKAGAQRYLVKGAPGVDVVATIWDVAPGRFGNDTSPPN